MMEGISKIQEGGGAVQSIEGEGGESGGGETEKEEKKEVGRNGGGCKTGYEMKENKRKEMKFKKGKIKEYIKYH